MEQLQVTITLMQTPDGVKWNFGTSQPLTGSGMINFLADALKVVANQPAQPVSPIEVASRLPRMPNGVR